MRMRRPGATVRPSRWDEEAIAHVADVYSIDRTAHPDVDERIRRTSLFATYRLRLAVRSLGRDLLSALRIR